MTVTGGPKPEITAYALVISAECEHCHELTSYEIPLTAPFDRKRGKPSGPGMSLSVFTQSDIPPAGNSA